MSLPVYRFTSLLQVLNQTNKLLYNISRLYITASSPLNYRFKFTLWYIRKPNQHDDCHTNRSVITFGTGNYLAEDEALYYHDHFMYHEPVEQVAFDIQHKRNMLIDRLRRSWVRKVYLYIPNCCTVYYKIEIVPYEQ